MRGACWLAPIVVVACGDPGDVAQPGITLPHGPPGAGDAVVVTPPEPSIARVKPPVDVVTTHGALAEWPRIVPGVEAHAFTSYDRNGGNDDGFGGTYSELYEANGEHVVFDALGPGVLRTLWFTSDVDGNGPLPEGVIRFYFDDETKPRYAMDANALYHGTVAPFLKPLVADNQTSSGGFASWVPFVFAKRLVVTTEKRAGFYQAHYETFPPDWDVTSGATDDLLGARFAATGFSTATLETIPLDHTFTGAGTIDVLRFEPASPPSKTDLQNARIRITFDGVPEPQVDAPLGTFFGSGLGEASVHAIPWTMEASRYESRFPMPFWEGAHVVVEGLAGTLSVHVGDALLPREEHGTFTVKSHTESPTTAGQDYVYADLDGAGKVAGTVLTVVPPTPQTKGWWEGDLSCVVDERNGFAIHGTGHEDDHLGGWSNEFLERPFSLPMQGCPKTEIIDLPAQGQTNANASMYRLFPGITFLRHVRHTTEHGPSNQRDADYSSATFLYRQSRVRMARSDRQPGSTSVRLAIQADNVGVKLRRVQNAPMPRQRARVVVDGAYVADWYIADPATEEDFFVPAQVTASKSAITVKLEGQPDFAFEALEAWPVLP